MGLSFAAARIKSTLLNRNGFTFLMAIFMVVIIGIMCAETGKSWKMIMKREREKELLFRGSQIKEAIENWYNPKYSVNGVKRQGQPHALMNLSDLLEDPYTLEKLRYLPQNYAAELDDKNPKCAPNCAKLKVYQDPMTGKEWTIIRGNPGNAATGQAPTISTSTQGVGIIGVASKSDEEPLKTDFKDTALENMGVAAVGVIPGTAGSVPLVTTGSISSGTPAATPGLGGKMTKYSEWKFIAEPPEKNDHAKIYRAYHERW